VEAETERLSTAIRDKYQRVKARLDRHSVFHPEANAQRAHTMYMVELQRWYAQAVGIVNHQVILTILHYV
jgi:hypothetical protein